MKTTTKLRLERMAAYRKIDRKYELKRLRERLWLFEGIMRSDCYKAIAELAIKE